MNTEDDILTVDSASVQSYPEFKRRVLNYIHHVRIIAREEGRREANEQAGSAVVPDNHLTTLEGEH